MMIKLFILILLMLMSMGFYLFIERKLMGLIHYRFGPNKILFLGLLQFLLDFLKLILKEYLFLNLVKMNYLYMIIFMLIVSLSFWFILMFNYILFYSHYYFIYLMFLMLLKLMFLMIFMLKISSMYMQVSFVRMMVQFISYDILIVMEILLFLILLKNFNLLSLFIYQGYMMFIFLNLNIFLIWLLGILMEMLRLPFDFYEGESELISGFNLELGSLNFMLLFMVEYLDLIYFTNLTILMFFYFKFVNLFVIILLLIILMVRLMVIRYRFDLLIYLVWKFLIFYLFIFIFILFNLINMI